MRFTDTQLNLLLSAAAHKTGVVVLPPRVRGQAAAKLVRRLRDQGLLTEIKARKSMPVWRRDGRGRAFALRITRKGQAAVSFAQGVQSALPGVLDRPGRAAGAADPIKPAARTASKPGAPIKTKHDLILDLLRKGTTLPDLMRATGWQAHSLRGFLAGVVRKKLRLPLTSMGRGKQRVYRIELVKPQPSSGKGQGVA